MRNFFDHPHSYWFFAFFHFGSENGKKFKTALGSVEGENFGGKKHHLRPIKKNSTLTIFWKNVETENNRFLFLQFREIAFFKKNNCVFSFRCFQIFQRIALSLTTPANTCTVLFRSKKNWEISKRGKIEVNPIQQLASMYESWDLGSIWFFQRSKGKGGEKMAAEVLLKFFSEKKLKKWETFDWLTNQNIFFLLTLTSAMNRFNFLMVEWSLFH